MASTALDISEKSLEGIAIREKGLSSQESDGPDHVPDWSEEEEKRLVWKIDLIIMPLLLLSFIVLQLDRANIGSALTDFFFRDVGITQAQFNVGQQLLSLGIVLLEIPSNYILYRIGPSLWLSGQIFGWGLVATFQAFQNSLGSFLATRLLLGMAESGFIPAALYVITRWYKRDETSKRMAIMFIGSPIGSGSSGLIAYGILQMRGTAGLAGWQWLFILEGLVTIMVGLLFFCFFPISTSEPGTRGRIRYFSDRERHILTQRVLLDDPTKFQARRNISVDEFKSTFTNWRLLPHVLIIITAMAPVTTMNSYSPSLVASLGYGRLQSNAMVSIGSWVSIVVTVGAGYLADKFGRRGPVVSILLLSLWVFDLCNRLMIHDEDKSKRFGVLTLTLSCATSFHAVNISWAALNSRSAGERSITLAVLIMAANVAAIIGSQLFQASDKPLYSNGWTAIVVLLSVGLLVSLYTNVQYWVLNRRLKKEGRLSPTTCYFP